MTGTKSFPSPEQVNRDLFLWIGNYVDRIRLVALREGIPPTEFTFELNLKSIVEVRSDYRPIEKDKWLLNIKLPRRDGALPTCEFLARDGKMSPFHPHVKPTIMGNGVWKDYKTYDPTETLLDLVLRICRSLQYDPSFIDTSIPKNDIGYMKAMNWFKASYEQNPNNFPWDKDIIVPIHMTAPASKIEEVPYSPQQENTTNGDLPPGAPSTPSIVVEEDGFTENQESQLGTRKKFSISLASEPYRPKISKKPELQIEETLNSDFRGNDFINEIYILNTAREDLLNHILWTSKSPENSVEQGGLLLGDVYFDASMKSYTGIVERAVPAKSTQSSSTHLSLNHAVWREMTERIDNEMAGKQVIGWYHTHPNNLDVYMSEADLNTQRMMFPNDWQFAIILNPHREVWRAFLGYDGRECRGFFVKQQYEETEETIEQASEASAKEPQNNGNIEDRVIEYTRGDS